MDYRELTVKKTDDGYRVRGSIKLGSGRDERHRVVLDEEVEAVRVNNVMMHFTDGVVTFGRDGDIYPVCGGRPKRWDVSIQSERISRGTGPTSGRLVVADITADDPGLDV